MTSGMPSLGHSLRSEPGQRAWTRGLLVTLLFVAGWCLAVLVLAPDARAAEPASEPAATAPPAVQGASLPDTEDGAPIAESAGHDDPALATRRRQEGRTAATDTPDRQSPSEPEPRPVSGTAPATEGRSAHDDGGEVAKPAPEEPAPNRTRHRPDTVAAPDTSEGAATPTEGPVEHHSDDPGDAPAAEGADTDGRASTDEEMEPAAAQEADFPSSSVLDPDGAAEQQRVEASGLALGRSTSRLLDRAPLPPVSTSTSWGVQRAGAVSAPPATGHLGGTTTSRTTNGNPGSPPLPMPPWAGVPTAGTGSTGSAGGVAAASSGSPGLTGVLAPDWDAPPSGVSRLTAHRPPVTAVALADEPGCTPD